MAVLLWMGWLPLGPPRAGQLPARWDVLGPVTALGQLTGPGSMNETFQRWGVYGTDLGHSFRHGDALYMVFGDTYGPNKSDWRSNVMARVDHFDPYQIAFSEMISDSPGHAMELLGSRKIPLIEQTVIPTYGISTGDRMYLHFMSVRRFQAHGRWSIGHAGLAYSDDDGSTWTKTGAMWSSNSNFAQVAFARDPNDDSFVYLVGIPAGRYGDARLARVPADAMLDRTAYRYWDGEGWSTREWDASVLVSAPVGELSLTWNDNVGQWVMMYLNELLDAVVTRTSSALTGPWSEEHLVLSNRDVPQLYAPYLIPGDPADDKLLFTLSRWDLYNVFLFEASLHT